MALHITQEDLSKASVKKEIVQLLQKNEKASLFPLGNLFNNLLPTKCYCAYENNTLIGVCDYYGIYKSACIYTESNEVSKQFGKILAQEKELQTPLETLLGMENMVHPAYEELIRSGKKPSNTPQKNFFELSLDNIQPFYVETGLIRPIEEKDATEAALLRRYIHNTTQEKPVTDIEREQILRNPEKFCVEIDGKVASIAFSNGIALEAFQILGVATAPQYRGKGLAKALCTFLISHMQEKGAKTAVLFTDLDNIAATKCYQSLGFSITDTFYVAQFEA